MSIYIADQNKVSFRWESGTYGNPSGTAAKWIGLVTDHSPTEEENVQSIRYTGTSSRNVSQQISTAKDYEGTMTFHPQDFRMFAFALGSTVDTSGTTTTHVISEADSDNSYAYTSGTNHNFPSFTVYDSKKAQLDGEHQVRTYNGCVVNSINISTSAGEPATCELNYMAQSLTLGSKTTDIPAIGDEDTSRPFLWSDVAVHLPSGTKITEVNDVSWSVNNNLERRHYTNGSQVVESLVPLNRDYEVSVTMDANSTWGNTFYEQYWQGGSTFNMMLEVSAAANKKGLVYMSGCKITSFESPSPAEGINEYSITVVPEQCNINSSDTVYNYNPW